MGVSLNIIYIYIISLITKLILAMFHITHAQGGMTKG